MAARMTSRLPAGAATGPWPAPDPPAPGRGRAKPLAVIARYHLREMPDRLPVRITLLSLLILLAAAGIHAAGPAVSWDLPARGVIIAIGVVVEAVLGGLLVALHWRSAAQRENEDAEPRSDRAAQRAAESAADLGTKLRTYLNGALVIGLVAIPVTILFTSVEPITRRRYAPPPVPLPSRGRHVGAHGGRAANDVISLAVVREVLIAALLAAVIAIAIAAWRLYRARRPRHPSGPLGEPADTAAELARAVESGRAALRDLDDARAAIIACYVAMERSLADAGTARKVAETPSELLARAVATGLISAAPADRLTRLFYEARFSTHLMPGSQRDEAQRALAELAAARPTASTGRAGTAAPVAAAGRPSGTGPGQPER